MLKISLALLAALAVVAIADPTLPSFPASWHATNYLGQMIVGENDIVLKGAEYWQMDSQFKRSAFISSNGGTSTFMDWDGKTYGDGSGPAVYYFMEGYQCDYWCPLSTDDMCNEAESLCQYDLLNNATFANSSVIDGNPVDLFTWNNYLAGISMAENALYSIHNVPVPYYRWQRLTPFGTYQGNITQTYGGFQAGLPTDDSWTKVIGTQYCQQGDDSQCPNNQRYRLFQAQRRMNLKKKL